MSVSPIPDGYHTITPYLFVEDASAFIDMAVRAFGAVEVMRMPTPTGGVMHAKIRIGDSILMLSSAQPNWPALPGWLHLYVPDVDAAYKRALDAGLESVTEPKDEFYGDRTAGVRDPCGITWWLATRVEEVSEEELARRLNEYQKGQARS